MKRCSKCGREMPENMFYKQGAKLRSWCKDCVAEANASRHKKPRGRLLPPPTKDTLYNLYVTQEYSIPDIAKILSVSLFKVRYWLVKYDIPRRSIIKSIDLSIKHGRKEPLKGRKKRPMSDSARKKMSDAAKKRGESSRGFSLKPNGYFEITRGANKNRAIHDVIMEEHIGRKLLPNECVHHINHNRTDNRIENLQLMTKSEHSKLHVKERLEKGEKFGEHLKVFYGEDNPKAKLTEEQVRNIKKSCEPTKALMEKYGVSKSTINLIRAGKSWKNIN